MKQIGADLSAMVGGNFVNWFNISGRSYKVIPQVQRIDRLNASQLENMYVTGPNNKLVPLSTIATIQNRTVPRSLNRMQQLNAVRIMGVPTGSLDSALKFLEDEGAKILPKGYVIDYTGESRQLRAEGNKFLPAFALAVVMIFLVYKAEAPRVSLVYKLLLGALRLFLILMVLFFLLPRPEVGYARQGHADLAARRPTGPAGRPAGASGGGR